MKLPKISETAAIIRIIIVTHFIIGFFFIQKRLIQDKTSTDYSFNYENQALFIFLLTFSCIRKTFSYILLVDLGDTPSDR
jgi:hypothetical protein